MEVRLARERIAATAEVTVSQPATGQIDGVAAASARGAPRRRTGRDGVRGVAARSRSTPNVSSGVDASATMC